MASDSKESSDRHLGTVNAGLSFGNRANDDKNTASAIPQDQVLLQALQAFIIPLIRGQSNIIQTDLGPEAEKLITALQEFISSVVVRPKLSAKKMVEVSWIEGTGKTELEGCIDDEEKENDDNSQDDSGHDSENDDEDGELSMESPPAKAGGDAAHEENSEAQDPEPTFRDKVLSALREHIFNTMPIRLLSFEPHGSSFQITLLERAGILERLVSMVPDNLDEPEHHPDKDFTEAKLNKEEAIYPLIFEHARYAILSHTWLRTMPGEISYGDWNKGLFDANSLGYNKLVNFCETAWRDHGLTFGWMDTICINKTSSSELDESIRSMYKWYKRASVCLIYLADTKTLSKMHLDPWFTRGWTLQELLAPDIIKFYNTDWKRFSESVNDKPDQREPSNIENSNASKILENVEKATMITARELKYGGIRSPISRRMQMAANRKVTQEEDTAYSLMGIFDISFATAYGEGAKRAFSRLLQAILTSYQEDMMDIFNWAGDTLPSMLNSELLPDSPQNYKHRSTSVTMWRPVEPLILTHMGLRISVILMRAISTSDLDFKYHPAGGYKATVNVSSVFNDEQFLSNTQHLLDNRCSGPDGVKGDALMVYFKPHSRFSPL